VKSSRVISRVSMERISNATGSLRNVENSLHIDMADAREDVTAK
jgi:hypothetical protein